MNQITPAHRFFFAAVGVLALWVGVWGYFFPAHVNLALPWLVPPLHARFLGAIYFSATVLMVGCLLARQWAEVHVVMLMIAIWTGMLFVISVLHLADFNPAGPPTYVWFAAYFFYPLIALWLTWRNRGSASLEAGSPPRLPVVVRASLLAQGLAISVLALALLFAPGPMTAVWPWKITPLLAQVYSGPFLAYGIGSLLFARCQTWREVRIAFFAGWVFAGGVLLASLIHHALFSLTNLSTWLWFGAFAWAVLIMSVLCALALLSYFQPAPGGQAQNRAISQ